CAAAASAGAFSAASCSIGPPKSIGRIYTHTPKYRRSRGTNQTRERQSILLLAAFPTRKSSVVETFLVLEGGNLKPKTVDHFLPPKTAQLTKNNRESGVATAVFSGERLQTGGARCPNLEVHPLLGVAPAVAALQPPEVLGQLQ
ncbi:unnamed protein product, partial [Ectocarpus sp. 12 AP-2014]